MVSNFASFLECPYHSSNYQDICLTFLFFEAIEILFSLFAIALQYLEERQFLRKNPRKKTRQKNDTINGLKWWIATTFDVSEKRYSKIDQHLARHSKHNAECLSCPPPFLCSQIITPLSHLRISTNQETVL